MAQLSVLMCNKRLLLIFLKSAVFWFKIESKIIGIRENRLQHYIAHMNLKLCLLLIVFSVGLLDISKV